MTQNGSLFGRSIHDVERGSKPLSAPDVMSEKRTEPTSPDTTGKGKPVQCTAIDGSLGTAYSYTRSDTCSIRRDVFFVHQAQANTDR
jgi:hypothetical protein